jgi:4-diphosphocytidyl-2-C-methyl-D-erythritol kinase
VAKPRHIEQAPAKINLDLLIMGRRADGYHELDSLVVFGIVADELVFEPAPDFELVVAGPYAHAVPRGESNLVLRAARELARSFGIEGGARIELVKNIPVAAGLGGGSADAAACLRGLRTLFALDCELPELLDLAADLGADVPVCLYSRPARIRGVGERIDPVRALPPLPLVLVNCGLPVDTGRVFRALAGRFEAKPRKPLPARPTLPIFAAWLNTGRNDLEPVTRALVPEVGAVLDALRAEPECLAARMSGSGGSCWGLFASAEQAEQVAERLRARYGWWAASAVVETSP